VRTPVQYGLERHPALPNVSAIVEFGKTSKDRAHLEFAVGSSAIGHAVAAPPDVPAERVSELRAAFSATMVDPESLADARKIGVEINPLSAEELNKIVVRTLNTSPTVWRARGLFASGAAVCYSDGDGHAS
jgi:tripartite-type tricarboxylate transporter receptor subunit TctC